MFCFLGICSLPFSHLGVFPSPLGPTLGWKFWCQTWFYFHLARSSSSFSCYFIQKFLSCMFCIYFPCTQLCVFHGLHNQIFPEIFRYSLKSHFCLMLHRSFPSSGFGHASFCSWCWCTCPSCTLWIRSLPARNWQQSLLLSLCCAEQGNVN